MPYKDPEKQKTYSREWARKKATEKRNGLPSPRSVNYKFLTPEERKIRKSESNKRNKRKYHDKMIKQVNTVLGSSCTLCGSCFRLACHRKDGTPHITHSEETSKQVVRNPEKFVRTCQNCHNGIHWLMRTFNMTWDDIISKTKLYASVA